MILADDAPRRARRAMVAEFLRFCLVGAVGFCVDALVLMALVHGAGLDAVTARVGSFAVAVQATFVLNRRWAFRQARPQPYFAAFSAYVGVQGLGFLCNFGVYALLYMTLPGPLDSPLFCLVIASALALIVNYAGARMMVFRGSRA